MLSTLHVEQRLPVSELADFTDVSQLLVNQCCELRVNGNGKAAWGIVKQHDGVGYLRRVNLKNGDRFGPCNPEQACARELMLDEQTLVVSLVGKLLKRRYPETTPGMIQEIPAYAVPTLRALLVNTWERSRDIVTIVLPLLVAGSVVLALLSHYGADAWINLGLTPVTVWWLGLPVALGVPILFGVLRKELSLLMVFQALGTQELAGVLDTTQIATFLVFLTFYVPCVSTFAMMLKLLGRRDALYSVALSIGVALAVAAVVRGALELAGWVL